MPYYWDEDVINPNGVQPDSGGAGGSVMVVTATTYNNVIDDAQIDKTFAEIEQAILAGNVVILRNKNYNDGVLTGIFDFQLVALVPEANVEFGVTTVTTGDFSVLDNSVTYAGFSININNEISAVNDIYPSNQPIG